MIDVERDLPPVFEMPADTALALRTALVSQVQRSEADAGRSRSQMPGAIREGVRGSRLRTRILPSRSWWAAAAAATAAALGGVVISSGASPSFASWTANPYQLSPASAAPAAAECKRSLVAERFPEGDAESLGPVVAEQRGDFTAVLLASPNGGWGVCLPLRDGQLNGVGTVDPMPAGSVLVVDSVPGQLNGNGAARMAVGRIDPTVRGVIVNTTDGRRVTASVAGGRFLAWWPSGAEVASATAYTASGRQLSIVPVQTATTGPTQTAPQ